MNPDRPNDRPEPQSLVVVPDTAAPGLTRIGVPAARSPQGFNPLGKWEPPPYQDAGELQFLETVVTAAAPVKITLPQHEHMTIENQGVLNVQISNDAATWFDWLPSGRVFVLDFHRGQLFYLQAVGAGSTVVVISTW